MLNPRYTEMLKQKDIIFEIFQYALEKAKVVGAENIFDFSLGNPSVPAAPAVNASMIDRIQTLDPLSLHGYSPGLGVPEARTAVAESLTRRFHIPYTMANIYMTIGAADALGHALRLAGCPGDEIITFAPCFSEYKPYTVGAGLELKVVPADINNFQINFDAFEELLNPKVTSILINSPSNPSGTLYSEETMERLANILREKSQEYGHPIYLISDEPYREILFGGKTYPYAANFYKNTLTCYSFSKSLSIAGERIGYLAVHPECEEAARIIEACPQVSRTMGLNGPASIMQRIVPDIVDETSDLSVYEKNKNILYNALKEYGYECVEPGGTFYMFPRTPIPDAYEFCERAKEKNLMVVPGDIFWCPGHIRIAYCVPTERVEKALPIFKELAEEFGLKK